MCINTQSFGSRHIFYAMPQIIHRRVWQTGSLINVYESPLLLQIYNFCLFVHVLLKHSVWHRMTDSGFRPDRYKLDAYWLPDNILYNLREHISCLKARVV